MEAQALKSQIKKIWMPISLLRRTLAIMYSKLEALQAVKGQWCFFFFFAVTVTNRCDGTRGHSCVGSNIPMPVVWFLIILIGETVQGGNGAGFPGSSLFAEKIQHGNITCITYGKIPNYIWTFVTKWPPSAPPPPHPLPARSGLCPCSSLRPLCCISRVLIWHEEDQNANNILTNFRGVGYL